MNVETKYGALYYSPSVCDCVIRTASLRSDREDCFCLRCSQSTAQCPTLLMMSVSLSASAVRNFEWMCVTVHHLRPSHAQHVCPLTFTSPFSAVHAETTSRQMYREHRRWRAGVNGAVIEIFLFCFQFLFIINSLTEDYSLCCHRLLTVHKTLSTFAIGFLI